MRAPNLNNSPSSVAFPESFGLVLFVDEFIDGSLESITQKLGMFGESDSLEQKQAKISWSKLLGITSDPRVFVFHRLER